MSDLFASFFDTLYTMPLWIAAIWSLVENILIFVVCIVVGEWLIRRYSNHAITEPAPPLTLTEVLLAFSCVLLNAVVTIVGIYLWRSGLIHVDFGVTPLRTIVDTIVLFFAMDFLMYVFHRLAHHRLLYRLIHSTHHQYENPRPLTLFALNPFEVLGFGGLWLLLLIVYPANWLSIIIYLTLNIVFGLVGHLGVEPMPNDWIRLPLTRYISTSTFHAEHHQDGGYNFGFYTLIWDHVFGTLSSDYVTDFESAHE